MDRDSRKILEIIICRYPRRKQEFEKVMRGIIKAATEERHQELSLRENIYMDRLQNEIHAVETCLDSLRPEEQLILAGRFWRDPDKLTPYEQIMDSSMDTAEKKKVINKILCMVGWRLGELGHDEY